MSKALTGYKHSGRLPSNWLHTRLIHFSCCNEFNISHCRLPLQQLINLKHILFNVMFNGVQCKYSTSSQSCHIQTSIIGKKHKLIALLSVHR